MMEGERRKVAILFLDIHGFTSISETMDHERLYKFTFAVMQALSRIVEQHNGYVDKFEGDLIMAMFGAKQSTENDSFRAVTCALKMLDQISEINGVVSRKGIELGVRIGVNTGWVTVAPDPSGHLTAIGDDVNLASRMESTAQLNTVQVTEMVHRDCGDQFEWEDLGEISVKGKRLPVHTFRPLGAGKVQYDRWKRASRISNTPLFGREAEFNELIGLWVKRINEPPSQNPKGYARHILVGMNGDSGIGKSRLVYEFLQTISREQEMLILRGNTLPYAQPAFWLWISILRNYFEISPSQPDVKEKFFTSAEALINASPPELHDSLRNAIRFIAPLLSLSSDPFDVADKTKYEETIVAISRFHSCDRREGVAGISIVGRLAQHRLGIARSARIRTHARRYSTAAVCIVGLSTPAQRRHFAIVQSADSPVRPVSRDYASGYSTGSNSPNHSAYPANRRLRY